MKTQIPRLLCPLGALTGIFCLAIVASAQGPPNGSASSRTDNSTARNSRRNAEPQDVLASPRLLFKVSIERKETTVEQALAKLNEYTPLHLVVEGTELRATAIYFHYTATPLRDILAGIAETGYWEWTRKNENTIVLKERFDSHRLDVHRPRNEAQKEVYERGAAFLGQAGNLPPNMQAALGNNGPTHGVPFNALPPAVQDNLRAMLAAHTNSAESEGQSVHINSANLSQSTVSLRAKPPQEGLNNFDVRLIDGSGSGISMSFVLFHDPRDGYNVVPGDQLGASDDNSAALDALSRQKALVGNLHLQDKVSLKMENASLFQALKALSVKANIAFSAPYPSFKGKPAEKSFTLPEMSLGEMLDKIVALYSGKDDHGKRYRYTWGQQGQPASQVFVFHMSLDERPTEETPPTP